MPDALAGLTTSDVARRYRVGEDKVRAWIKAGELAAINTASALSKPRFVVTVDALATFEQRRTVGPAPKAPKRPRKNQETDYYPD
jgi:hypothetical protein